jgi:HPt (histidine-containing phosphotransfer) domain-containing protein
MNAYLTKPFAPYDLFAAVEQFSQEAPAARAPDEPGQAPSAAPCPVDLVSFRSAMRDAGAEDAVEEILDTFAQTTPRSLAALAGAVEASDAAAIANAAHAFKSPAGAIGAQALAALLQEIELAGMEGAIDRARTGFEQVLREAEAVLACLRTARPASGPDG